MSDTQWQTVKQAGVACPTCNHEDRCTVSPDGGAFLCWHTDGKVHQTGKNALARTQTPDDYGNHAKPKAAQRTFLSAAAAIAGYGKGNPDATWNYLDAQGEDVLTVARWNLPDDGGKDVRPVAFVGTGWIMGGLPKGQLAPLYHLQELQAADPTETVFICEGEKCVDAAAGIGLLSVTSVGGACRAAGSDWGHMAGRDVVILPDNDRPGSKYAAEVATILAGLDPPATVQVVNLPDLDDGGDIFDFIEARDSMDSPDIKAGILALAAAVVPVKPVLPLAALRDDDTSFVGNPEPENPFLIADLIRQAEMIVLAAPTKSKKSQFALQLSLAVATGTPFLGEFGAIQGRVLYPAPRSMRQFNVGICCPSRRS